MKVAICIPTMNRPNLLKQTLDSIVKDNVDKNSYEIVISDNSDNFETKELVGKYKDVDIRYFKNDVKGFYNSVSTLLHSNADFLKLHNDYTAFLPGAFKQFVKDVQSQFKHNSIFIFTNGELGGAKSFTSFNNFNDFIRYSSFYVTWSSAFSISSEQLYSIKHDKKDVDEMFPHTSLLFEVEAEEYVVNDKPYFENIQVEKKGGYNIFYNFGVLFLDMLEKQLTIGKIRTLTYYLVKYRLLVQFLSPWYYKTVETRQGYTFDISNVKNHIVKKYGIKGYVIMVLLSKTNKALKSLRIR